MAGNFRDPQSANEAILQNILGEDNELREPQSVTEFYLQKILEQGGGGSALEGTSILSTGETAGKVLASDGSGGALWNPPMSDSDIDAMFLDKGHIISMNLDGTARNYRIIKNVGGSVMEVVCMEAVGTSRFAESGNIYEGEALDTFLNTTWYNTLSADAKAAIVDKTIRQDEWYSGASGNPDYSGYYGSTKPGTTAYTVSLGTATFGNSITRHIYALSLQDVLDYVLDTSVTDGLLQNYNIWKMFWNDEIAHTGDANKIWTRSSEHSSICVNIFGGSGSIDASLPRTIYQARPAFQIDLFKITYTEV